MCDEQRLIELHREYHVDDEETKPYTLSVPPYGTFLGRLGRTLFTFVETELLCQ